MINDIKRKYLSMFTGKTLLHYQNLFLKAESLEEKYGLDLAEFTMQQFETLLLTYTLRTFQYASNTKARIKNYVKWYSKNVAPVNLSEITDVDTTALVDRFNEDQVYFLRIIQLFQEIDKCENILSQVEEPHIDPNHFLFHKIVCMLLWHGYTTKELPCLKWSDIDGQLNSYTHVNGHEISELENELLSQWYLKAGTYRGSKGSFLRYPDTPYLLKGSPKSASRATNALGELNRIEKQWIRGKQYSFDAINIRMNGNMVRAILYESTHPIQNPSNLNEYRQLLNIDPKLNDREARVLVRLYKYYKIKIE